MFSLRISLLPTPPNLPCKRALSPPLEWVWLDTQHSLKLFSGSSEVVSQMCACVPASVCVCVCVCVCLCVCVSVCVCVPARARAHALTRACLCVCLGVAVGVNMCERDCLTGIHSFHAKFSGVKPSGEDQASVRAYLG